MSSDLAFQHAPTLSGTVGSLPGIRNTNVDGSAPGATVQTLLAGSPTAPANVAATAPLPYQTFGQIAQINPAYMQAAQQLFPGLMASASVDPNSAQSYLTQYEQQLQSALAPSFLQQQQQLAQSLQARGIQNSGAAGELEGNLLGQQAGAVAAQTQPLIAQAFGYNQSDVAQNAANRQQAYGADYSALQNQLAANAGFEQQANAANASTANQASLYNAGQYTTAVTDNYTAYNNYLNELLGLGASNSGALQAAYLNSFGPNTGVTGAFNNALAGTQNVFGNVFGQALSGQGQALGGAFGALGSFAGAGLL